MAVRQDAALAAKDQTIEVLREQIAFLQEQVRMLNDRLVQMADPMAAARAAQMRAQAERHPGPEVPSRVPTISPAALRMRFRDMPSKDEQDRLIAIRAEERAREIAAEQAPSAGRGEVEASFSAPGS